MKRLVLFIAMAFAGSCQAADWILISFDPGDPSGFTQFDYDATSVVNRDGYLQAWVRFTNTKEGPIPNTYPVTNYRSSLSLQHFNCQFKESTSSQILFFSGLFVSGENVKTLNFGRDSVKRNMQVVAPGTYGEAILNAVCAGNRKK